MSSGNRAPEKTEIEGFDPSEVQVPVARRFSRMAARFPSKPALIEDGHTIAYQELDKMSLRLAARISDLELSPGSPVGVLAGSGVAAAAGMLAALKSGAPFVMLDAFSPRAWLAQVVSNAGLGALLCDGKNLAQGEALLARHPGKAIDMEASDEPGARKPAFTEPRPEDLACIVYTSGSTGRPKGICHTQRTLMHSAMRSSNAFEMTAQDNWLLLANKAHMGGINGMLRCLLNGATVVFYPLIDLGVAGMERCLAENRITILQLVPSLFRLFAGSLRPEATFPDLRLVLLGGEAAVHRDVLLFQRHFPPSCRLVNHLGCTEFSGFCQYFVHHDAATAEGIVPVGFPPEGAAVYLVDDSGKRITGHDTGRIAIESEFLSIGYWRDPEATVQRFRPAGDGPRRVFIPGDLGRFLPDGALAYLGRKDFQVKIRGYRIETEAVDAALLSLPAVRQAVVAVRRSPEGEPGLAAFVTAAQHPPPSTEALRRALSERLPDYMIPATFVFLDDLPRLPTGKVDRNALPNPGAARPALDQPFVEAESEPEKSLARIWCEILGVDRVGIHDGFFDLGGHSLAAARLSLRIRNELGAVLSLSDIHASPTLVAMAERLRSAAEEAVPPPIDRAITADLSHRHAPFALTPIQEAYWAGRSRDFDLGGASTHFYDEIEVKHLNIPRFRKALESLIRRHDMLRAVALSDGRQQILEKVPDYPLEVRDLRHDGAETAAEDLNRIRQAMSDTVLPADQWPLFDIRLSRLPQERTRIHLSIDALVADAFSKSILYDELGRLYRNPEAELPPLEISFRDCVSAETDLRNSEEYHRARDYWMSHLARLPEAPMLPLAQSPSSRTAPIFARMERRLAGKVWQRLKTRAARSGLTASVLLLAAFSEVLKVWSRQRRFTLNLTFFNRPPIHPQVNGIVGDFTSLLLLEVTDAPDDPFEARARALHRRLWRDLDHRAFSGVEVLRELHRLRGKRATPLMPVVFTSLLAHDRPNGRPNALADLGETVFGISKTSQVWLDHVVFESGEDLVLRWNLLQALFPDGMAEAMLGSYEAFLNRLANEEAAWQENRRETARKLVPHDQIRLKNAVNATQAPLSDARLHDLFFEQAAQNPHRPAVVARDRTLTYAALDRMAGGIGRRLQEMGARPNALVAVVLEKGWEQAVALLGILAAGGAYLPVDPDLPPERIHFLVENGQARIVLTSSALKERIDFPRNVEIMEIRYEEPGAAPPQRPEPVGSPDDLAYVIFTSGSTGLPKGVMIDHRGVVNTVLDINRRFGIGPDDVVLAISSLTFDLSVYDLFGILAAGGTVVVPEPAAVRNPARWAQLIAEHRVTVWNSVPALMELLVDHLRTHPKPSAASLRLVMMSGDWIPLDLPEKVRRLPGVPETISLGGATEASIWSILYRVTTVDPSWKSIPYGKPMTNQRFHVFNDLLEPCPVWVAGMLFIEGVGLARGYWRDTEKTEKSFIIHPDTGARLYRTGDLGRYLPDGNIEFLGRDDAQVKVQGFRVELGEIEAALARHPEVDKAAAAAVGEPRGAKRLVAYIVPLKAQAPPPERLRAFLKSKIPDYMVPSQYVALDEIPLTPNGKVDRSALPVFEDSSPAGGKMDEAAADRDSRNRTAEIVAQILDLEQVDPGADLLNLGANSIHMIRIANRLEAEWGVRPEIDEFYENPTIRWLAESIPAAPPPPPPRPPAAQAPGAAPPPAFDFIADPGMRQQFKAHQPGLRRPAPTAGDVRLPAVASGKALETRFKRRRSVRRFSSEPISEIDFSGLLECLRRLEVDGNSKYLYGSAGGLYPVQAYLYVKPRRVASVRGGIYYYEPVAHGLAWLSEEPVDESLYHYPVNRPAFKSAAFALFLIAQIGAIAPMYGARSLDFTMIEAGLICQLLETAAPDFGLGLCQVGGLEFERIRHLFGLDAGHVYLHSLVGGKATLAEKDTSPKSAETYYGFENDDEDHEEGDL